MQSSFTKDVTLIGKLLHQEVRKKVQSFKSLFNSDFGLQNQENLQRIERFEKIKIPGAFWSYQLKVSKSRKKKLLS